MSGSQDRHHGQIATMPARNNSTFPSSLGQLILYVSFGEAEHGDQQGPDFSPAAWL